ncbi:PREDICTED: HORMA domain-containing protein 1 [Propithecus coquereli]|uniref:HORMA domain-containing protein 1 n=1 Tax=Propithecus coquereli TaxID=379532 RepID=UPI00063FD172|nr:PREDICTED: HORMA domain-containing protein 1 [Propithecus coquereli]
MAIAQLQRTSMSALAFPNKISTEQQSLVLVKRLLAVSVSCITYLRGIFPECAYGTRYLDVTPPDYQPPGFKDGDCEGVIFEGEPMYLNVGEVPTPFHTFKVKMTTEKERVENVDSSILSPKQLKTPLQKILMDKDDLGDEQGHYINDDFDIDTKMEEQKKNPGSSELGESSFVCEEDEIMRSEESPDLSISHSQFEQLVSKTSELDVSESKTRSGKIFQNKMANGNQPVKSKENRKRSHLKSGKTVLHPFDSSSQESVSKRRKFSEPKEHI